MNLPCKVKESLNWKGLHWSFSLKFEFLGGKIGLKEVILCPGLPSTHTGYQAKELSVLDKRMTQNYKSRANRERKSSLQNQSHYFESRDTDLLC